MSGQTLDGCAERHPRPSSTPTAGTAVTRAPLRAAGKTRGGGSHRAAACRVCRLSAVAEVEAHCPEHGVLYEPRCRYCREYAGQKERGCASASPPPLVRPDRSDQVLRLPRLVLYLETYRARAVLLDEAVNERLHP